MGTYFITGAGRPKGIGFQLCKQLAARGEEVIATCRTPSDELMALPVDMVPHIDLNEDNYQETFEKALAGRKIDVLVNNAGILSRDVLGECERETFQHQFNTNATTPLMLTQALLPHINRPGKVIMITSRMGSIEDNTSGKRYSYRMSKAALNAGAKSLSHDLRDEGIAVGIIHPGRLATDMVGPTGEPVDTAVSDIITRIDECSIENSGIFYHAKGHVLPW